MPEGDLRILGADTHLPKRTAPLVIAGGLVLAYLIFRGRSQQTAMPTVDQAAAQAVQQNNAYALEFYQAQQQAAYQIQQLTAMNALEQQQLNQQYQLSAGLNPGLLAQTIPWNDFYNLPADVRNSLQSQVNNGQLFQTASASGVTFGPTQMGIQGHPYLVTARSSSGLFGGSSSVTGPAGSVPGTPPVAPDPGLFGIVDAITSLLQDIGLVTSPVAAPRNPNPNPYGGTQPWIGTPPFYPVYA